MRHPDRDDDDDPEIAIEDEYTQDPEDDTEFEDRSADANDEGQDAADEAEPADTTGASLHPENDREVHRVPLGSLVLEYKFWANPRTSTGLDDASLVELADDIAKNTVITEAGQLLGINDPLKVVRIKGPNGSVVNLVLDGQRRHKAASLLFDGDSLVPVTYREPDVIEWSQQAALKYLAEVLKIVGLRKDLSSCELCESAYSLRGSKDETTGKVITIKQIAAVVCRSEAWVSKILAARDNASPALLHRWRKGEIPDETFMALATGVKDKEKQADEADKVVAARNSGDKGAARRIAKESKERAANEAREARDKDKVDKAAAKAKKKADRDAATAAKAKVKKGKAQAELPTPTAKPAPAPAPASDPAPKKPKPMSAAVIEDLLDQARKKPPTADLVKGIILGIQAAAGLLDLGDLPKGWHAYIHYLAGTQPASKKSKSKKR